MSYYNIKNIIYDYKEDINKMADSGNPALVLNADFRPLSYYPLSLWCWQDAVKSVFLERVSIVSNYNRKIYRGMSTIIILM